jgi:hypothetical protein
MTLINTLRIAGSTMLLFVCAGFAAAQGQAFDVGSTSSQLAMSATVQTSIQLNLSTGTGGATVSGNNSTGLFSVGFGSVNGLGLGTPGAGVSVSADATGATYSTPINMKPIFTGFPNPATASVTIAAGSDPDQAIAREGAAPGTMTAVTTNHASLSGVNSESVNERFVGFRISRTEEAGAKAATFVYTITVD